MQPPKVNYRAQLIDTEGVRQLKVVALIAGCHSESGASPTGKPTEKAEEGLSNKSEGPVVSQVAQVAGAPRRSQGAPMY